MKIFPSEIDKLKLKFGYGKFKWPYSKFTKDHNIKPREVKCETCDYTIVTDLAAPHCGMCNGNLITIVNNGKLANRNSQSA